MPKIFLNGNFHSSNETYDFSKMGIYYLGDGLWEHPDNINITGGHDDDWFIILKDKTEIHVYTIE